MVERSTTGAYWVGWVDGFVDGSAPGRTRPYYLDVFHNLAKVRVAGSNPVVRSKKRLTSTNLGAIDSLGSMLPLQAGECYPSC